MAGVGEGCTHAAALMFYIVIFAKIRASTTPTQVSAYWVEPAVTADGNLYKEAGEINFTSASTKYRALEETLAGETPKSRKQRTSSKVPVPTESEVSQMFAALSSSGEKAAVLAVVPEHCTPYIPELTNLAPTAKYPCFMDEVFKEEYYSLKFDELLDKCRDFFRQLTVTPAQVSTVESGTTGQADNPLWKRIRAGKVSASKSHQVAHTDMNKPAPSIIKSVCYPSLSCKTTPEMKWGIDHEDDAVSAYIAVNTPKHVNLRVRKCGVLLSTEHPHLAASPDALVECDCCGEGVGEVSFKV